MPGGFRTLSDVDKAFYGLFGMNQAVPTLDLGGGQKAYVRFYKRGGGKDAQDAEVKYPSISIQPFPPVVDVQRRVRNPSRYEGDFETVNGEEVGRLVPYALPLDFRYQVSAASVNQQLLTAIQEWFYRAFDPGQVQPSLLLDATDTQGHGLLGEPVPYRMQVRDVPRDDKVFELAYDFTLKPWVNLLVPSEDIPTLQEIDFFGRFLTEASQPDQD